MSESPAYSAGTSSARILAEIKALTGAEVDARLACGVCGHDLSGMGHYDWCVKAVAK